MSFSLSRRLACSMLVAGAVAVGSSIVGISAASAAGPQKTVKASRIASRPGTLAPGTAVSSANLGQRVFTDALHGFALARAGTGRCSTGS